MNAIELLENDHRKVEGLFAEIEKLGDGNAAERQRLFEQIRIELKVHEAIEEELFYPALQANEKTRDIVLEGYQEHHVADMQVAEIGELSASDEMWMVKVKVLKETIEHHIEEEEKEMFPKARKVAGAEELENLGDLMEDRKEELLPRAA
jgi:hemerythrin superfamily protein